MQGENYEGYKYKNNHQILKSCQGIFWERFAQIIQWVSHLGSAHPLLNLQPSQFLDDWPMMMDGWTTPAQHNGEGEEMLIVSTLEFWCCNVEEIGDERTFETHSFPRNIVSVALLCTGCSPNPSREASDYKDAPTHSHSTSNYTDIGSVLTIKTLVW